MARQKKLLEERYDLSVRVERQCEDDARQADPGRPDGQAAGGDDLGAAGRDCPRTRSATRACSPRASCRCRIPNHEVGRHALPADGDQAAAAARAVRPRLRPARAFPARVPAGHLPDHPARPGRRVAGQGGDGRELPGDLQRHPQRQGPGRPAAAGHAVPAAAVQRHGRPQDGTGPTACRAWPASTATSTATRRRRRTWSATSGRSRTAAASTRRACAASTSSGCSARSGR